MKITKNISISKILFILFLTSIIICPVLGQNTDDRAKEENIVKIQYTILDKDSKSFRSFFGTNSGEIMFKLVELKNISTNETILGVEINIKTQETEQISSSIAFAGIGQMWGISANATYRNIQNSGYIFLNESDLEAIINFLNEIIGATSKAQDKFTMYKISIGKQFELGMIYDIDSSDQNKWGFTFSADKSSYLLNYQDGISMLKSLLRFHKYIKINQIDQ